MPTDDNQRHLANLAVCGTLVQRPAFHRLHCAAHLPAYNVAADQDSVSGMRQTQPLPDFISGLVG